MASALSPCTHGGFSGPDRRKAEAKSWSTSTLLESSPITQSCSVRPECATHLIPRRGLLLVRGLRLTMQPLSIGDLDGWAVTGWFTPSGTRIHSLLAYLIVHAMDSFPPSTKEPSDAIFNHEGYRGVGMRWAGLTGLTNGVYAAGNSVLGLESQLISDRFLSEV
ncbi:hypothetical protein BDV59DRAFT_50340 [Aspergillus ambiguus]|uniref:uncharacterized protein n=1 Tax=Aspergillus ambiguus TaxID=176160 RepID=UPI003CCD6E16